MDGDDIAHPNRIEIQLDYLLKHPKIDLVGSNAEIIDQDGRVIGNYKKLSSNYCQKIMLRFACIDLLHPTWLGKREIFNTLKYRNFYHVEDYDFMLRALFYNYKFANLNINLLQYRIVQHKAVSVSQSNSFVQYKNSLVARQQLIEALKIKSYPDLPKMSYLDEDIRKFQFLTSSINELRNCVSKKIFFRSLKLVYEIVRIDYRPLSYRLKNRLLKLVIRPIDIILK